MKITPRFSKKSARKTTKGEEITRGFGNKSPFAYYDRKTVFLRSVPVYINKLDISVIVKDKKSKSTGERVLLCTLSSSPNMLVLGHFAESGELIDRRCYPWYTDESKKLVWKIANSDYRMWKEFLMKKETDYEAAMINKICGSKILVD